MNRAERFRRLLGVRTPDELLALAATCGEAQPGRAAAERAVQPGGDFVVWGAGQHARAALAAWAPRGLVPRYLVDSDPQRHGTLWCGLPVLSPQALAADPARPPVVVAAMLTHEIGPALEAMARPHLYVERDGTLGNLPGHGLLARRAGFQRVFERLHDEASRATLLAVAAARLFQDHWFPMKGHWFTAEVTVHPQYFVPELGAWGAEEHFVDCGAFDGDTAIDFAAQMNRHRVARWSALAIEADRANVERSRARLADYGLDAVQVVHGVLGAGAGGAHNCHGGTVGGDAPALALAQACGALRPTLVKLDIEGAEIPTLVEATDALRAWQPRVAACMYHSTADLVEVPLTLAAILPQARLHVRHHRAGSLWETVCYAVPA